MNDTFQSGKHCGDHEALVAYLYDECDRADREAIAAHLTHCAACAEEVASLRGTRTQLAAWAPPDARLGFQITSADQRNEPLPFVPRAQGPWWREPLPAWAQAAAAALIFAAGLTAGSIGRSPEQNTVATAAVAAPVEERAAQTVAVPAAAPVSAIDFARFEQRLRALESGRTQSVSAPGTPAAGAGSRELLAQVNQLIADSEERQRMRVDDVALQFEAQRIADLQRVGDNLGVIRTATGEEFRRRDSQDPFRQISFQPRVFGR